MCDASRLLKKYFSRDAQSIVDFSIGTKKLPFQDLAVPFDVRPFLSSSLHVPSTP